MNEAVFYPHSVKLREHQTPTYCPGQVSHAVDVFHLRPDAQRLTWSVNWHICVDSQLSLWGGNRNKYGHEVWQLSTRVCRTDRQKERKKKKWLPYQTCCLDRFPGPAGWAGALWQLQQPLLHSSCLAPSPTPSDLHLMDVKTAVVHDSFCFDLNNKAECEKL